jgi:hypothetical protein
LSLGASWVFSFQPVLPPDYRPPLPFQKELGSVLPADGGDCEEVLSRFVEAGINITMMNKSICRLSHFGTHARSVRLWLHKIRTQSRLRRNPAE